MLDKMRRSTACFARIPRDVQAASASIFSSHFKRLYRSEKLATSYVLFDPPVTEAASPLAVLLAPPLSEAQRPLAVLPIPPLTEANCPLISFRSAMTNPPKLEKLCPDPTTTLCEPVRVSVHVANDGQLGFPWRSSL